MEINMQPIKNLTDNGLQQLQAFLSAHQLMNLVELHGFLTAVVSAPGLMPPSQWIEHAGLSGKVNDAGEFNTIFGIVMSLYNDICTQLSKENFSVENFFKSANITDNLRFEKQKWARCYLRAAKLDLLWDHKEIAEDFFPIALLSFNQEQLQKMAENDDSRIEKLLQIAEDGLSQSVMDVNEIWRKKRVSSMKEMRAKRHAPQKSKVGRNDFCLCGSGKKYKKCCMH